MNDMIMAALKAAAAVHKPRDGRTFEQRVRDDWEDQQDAMSAALGYAESIVGRNAYVPPVPLWGPGVTVVDVQDQSGATTPDWAALFKDQPTVYTVDTVSPYVNVVMPDKSVRTAIAEISSTELF